MGIAIVVVGIAHLRSNSHAFLLMALQLWLALKSGTKLSDCFCSLLFDVGGGCSKSLFLRVSGFHDFPLQRALTKQALLK